MGRADSVSPEGSGFYRVTILLCSHMAFSEHDITGLLSNVITQGQPEGRDAEGKMCGKGPRTFRPSQSAPFSPNRHVFANQEAPRQIWNRGKMGSDFKTIRLAKVNIMTSNVEGIWGNENSHKTLVRCTTKLVMNVAIPCKVYDIQAPVTSNSVRCWLQH